jgi:NADP-dependent 3-hydroxy acid dehydrogenase YdfG
MSSAKILFITGANTGLGFETVKSLCRSDETYTILLGSRDLGKARAAIEKVRKEVPNSPSVLEPIQVDIEDDESINYAFKTVSTKYDHLDVLINNAGKCTSI